MRRVAARAPGAALTTVADALRSGAAADRAWSRVGVVVRDGLPTASSLLAATGDASAAAAGLAAARLAHELGASPAPVLDAVRLVMEEEADATVRRDTALAGPAASATVLGWLPVTGLALGVALGVNPLAVLLEPGAGWALLGCGTAASVIGRLWSRRLVRSASAVGRADPPRRPPRGPRARPGVRVGPRMRAFASPPLSTPRAVPVTVVLDLVAAACESGASVPRTLEAVGAAVGGRRGASLVEVGTRLVQGEAWAAAWSLGGPELAVVADALRPAWEDGASPVASARAAARARRRENQAMALAAAERLGVQLLLPLVGCHLPAFVLLGIAPVLVSFVGQPAGG